MEHTMHLHIILNTPALLPTIFRCLRFPAPILQGFKIVQGEAEDAQPLDVRYIQGIRPLTPKIEGGMFGGHAPALRLVQIHFTSASRTHALLNSITNGGGPRPNIQHLDLSHQVPMHPEIFYNFLEAISPSLRILVLRNAGPKIESGGFNVRPRLTSR
jgi:hypothetical protein